MPIPPKIPTGQEIYNSVMSKIEPDLTTEGMAMLEQKYANETPQQFAERKQRYVAAFKEYDKQFQVYMDTLTAEVRQYKQQSVKSLEMENQTKEDQKMLSLEDAFSTSA